MKRLILPAIILLPVVTLALWCYYGVKQPRLPVGQIEQATNSAIQTNLNYPHSTTP